MQDHCMKLKATRCNFAEQQQLEKSCLTRAQTANDQKRCRCNKFAKIHEIFKVSSLDTGLNDF